MLDCLNKAEAYSNLNAMSDSFSVFFDDNENKIDTLTNCEITGGKLQISSGQTQGIATSIVDSKDYDIGYAEMRKYSNFPFDESDTYEISNDGGVTWHSYIIGGGTILEFTDTTGNRDLMFRITMNRSSIDDTTPSYESVVVLTKPA